MSLWCSVAVAIFAAVLTLPAAAAPAGSSIEPVLQATAMPPIPDAGPVGPRDAVPATIGPGGDGINDASGTAQSPTEGSEPAALQIPAIEPEPEPPKPVITLKIDVDLSAQRMTVSNGGETLHSWPVSSGRGGYSTPTGTYKPQWRSKMWRSKQYDGAPMPHSIFYHRGYAIHGTYATGMLGRPASHGCVRLSPKHAAALYQLVSQHGMESTQIVVRGKAPSSAVAARKSDQRSREAMRRRPPRGYANYGTPFWVPW